MTVSSIFSNVSYSCSSTIQRFISDWNPSVFKIVKIAGHILFPIAAVFIAHCLLPLAWAPIGLPAIAIGSIVAAFFSFNVICIEAPPLAPGAPRGIDNTAGNCWVNSLFQMIHADKNIKEWLLSDACPEELRPFSEYIHAYDQSITLGQSVVSLDSQMLRTCLASLMRPGIRFGHERQEDPTEGWILIHDRLPTNFKSEMRQTRNFNVAPDQPRILETTRSTILSPIAHLSLAITGKNHTFSEMMYNHCNAREIYENLNCTTDEGIIHRYSQVDVVETLRFLTAPPSLFIDFKRSQAHLHTQIQIPDLYFLELADASRETYELTSFAVHLGSSGESGHYVSYRKGPGDGLWYKISDRTVTPLNHDEMMADRSQAYFVNYSKVIRS